MSDKNEKKDARDLLDSEDYEYEKEIYDKQKAQEAELEAKRAAATEARRKREKEAKREHDRQLARERIELMKQKSSSHAESTEEPKQEAEQADSEQTEPEETIKNKESIRKKADNFFYHNKWWLGMTAIVLVIAGFILYNELTRKKADLTIMMIADNGLQYKQEQLEEFFEEYVDDIDGNGYVHVNVQMIPLDRTNKSQTQADNNTMFLAEIHSTENMLVITDSNTDDYYMEIMDNDLRSKFPDNKYVDEKGFSLNMKLFADKIGYDDMPNDVHISIRKPVETVDDSLETAKENYEKSFKYLEKIVDDLTQKAKETNDPGLTTPPKEKDTSSSIAE